MRVVIYSTTASVIETIWHNECKNLKTPCPVNGMMILLISWANQKRQV